MAAIDLCTLEEVRAWLGIIQSSGGSEDVKLTRLITASSQMFLTLCQRSGFVSTAVTGERRNGNGTNTINPYRWPVLSVQSVTVGGVAKTASNGITPGYLLTPTQIILIGDSFPLGVQNVVLTYTEGWAAIPADVTQAVIELVSQKYRRSQHIDLTSAGTQDGQSTSFSVEAIPKEVKDVANRYKIKAIIE